MTGWAVIMGLLGCKYNAIVAELAVIFWGKDRVKIAVSLKSQIIKVESGPS